jgi:hypothetical protein
MNSRLERQGSQLEAGLHRMEQSASQYQYQISVSTEPAAFPEEATKACLLRELP